MSQVKISERAEVAMAEAGVCGGCIQHRAAMGERWMCPGCVAKVRAARQAIRHEIEEVAAEEFHLVSNQGTYGGSEAVRKMGTADPTFANHDVYETVGGKRRVSGCEAERAPGTIRRFSDNVKALAARRRDLAVLRSRRDALASLPVS